MKAEKEREIGRKKDEETKQILRKRQILHRLAPSRFSDRNYTNSWLRERERIKMKKKIRKSDRHTDIHKKKEKKETEKQRDR